MCASRIARLQWHPGFPLIDVGRLLAVEARRAFLGATGIVPVVAGLVPGTPGTAELAGMRLILPHLNQLSRGLGGSSFVVFFSGAGVASRGLQ